MESLCPVCQKGKMELAIGAIVRKCSQCYFQCHVGQLESISAAMGLSRKISTWSKPMLSDSFREHMREEIKKAEQHVIEVFGGE